MTEDEKKQYRELKRKYELCTGLINSPAWKDYLKPSIEEEMARLNKDILTRDNISHEEREQMRHQWLALDKFLKKPDSDLVYIERNKEMLQKIATAEDEL